MGESEGASETPARLVLRAIVRFTKAEVLAHLSKKHPNCPTKIRERVVAGVADAPWVDARLGAAVGLVMQAAVRHRLTNYEAEIASAQPADKVMIKRKYNREATQIIASWNSDKLHDKPR